MAISGFPFAILFCCFTAVGVVGYVVDTHRLSLGVGVDCLGRFPAVILSPSSCPATTSGRPSQKSFPKINARVVRIGADGGDGHSLRVELGQLIVVAFVPIEPTDGLTDTGGGPTAEILTQLFGFPLTCCSYIIRFVVRDTRIPILIWSCFSLFFLICP